MEEKQPVTWEEVNDYLNYIMGILDGMLCGAKQDKVTIDTDYLYDCIGDRTAELHYKVKERIKAESKINTTITYTPYVYQETWPTEVTCDSLKTTTSSATNTTDKR